jgi:hypothetical protein
LEYDVVIWLFLNLLGCGLGVALIAAKRPGWGAIAAGLAARRFNQARSWRTGLVLLRALYEETNSREADRASRSTIGIGRAAHDGADRTG